MASDPAVYLALRRHRSTVTGHEHLVGQADREFTVPAGSQVVLRKEGENYALVFTAGKLPVGKSMTELSLANAPRGALRDSKLPQEAAPF